MVQVSNISRSYRKGEVKAVAEVSFEVEKAEIFGLIGPDGAGKTSLLRIIATLLLADKGTIRIGDWDVVKDYRKIRRIIGYMPGRFSLYPDLSVEENLRFFADMFDTDLKENYALIEPIYAQLAPFRQRRAAQLSGGMKQKLALCCALIHRPELLLLDEPTTGVDPVSRKEFWTMLRQLKKQQLTILVSTPYMDEAMQCDRVALMTGGKIMNINTPEAIIGQFPDKLLAIRADSTARLLRALKELPGKQNSYAFGRDVHLVLPAARERSESSTAALAAAQPEATGTSLTDIKNWLEGKGLGQIRVRETEPTIEDCFIRLLS